MRPPRRLRAALTLAVAGALAATVSACTGGSSGSTSVFDVQVGQCFNPPDKVQAQLSSVDRVPCDQPHTQEAYAKVSYTTPSGASTAPDAFPGADALATFAQGRCAQEFASYVGVDYLDSSLYFTYLLPSARGWEQNDDRSVLCFVTTTGQKLTASVKGSKR